MTGGRALELFFVDGNPDGMATAEVFNWTGHVLRIPRTRLAEGLRRGEAGQTGIYLLIGADDEGPLAYIGEAENVARRLVQHARDKDWWDLAVIITTTGDALNKAHVKYLESRLVEAAHLAGSMRIANSNAPPRSSLNEAATANMESFLETLHMTLPAIRVDVFETRIRSTPSAENSKAGGAVTEFTISNPSKNFQATARLVDGELVVLAGAQMRASASFPPSMASLARKRAALESSGDIKQGGGFDILLRNYAFASPSGASDFVLGRATSGPKEWKLPDGRSYAEWEADQLGKALP
jgi:uncharacterized protein DUF4357